LAHRCEYVLSTQGIRWYNDSKGTNIGATQAAITSVGDDLIGKVVLLAGGLAKGQDFKLLQEPIQRYVKQVILFGEDATLIASQLADATEIKLVGSFEEAVKQAQLTAQHGDAVLLSPACASFDMFKDYQERGNIFKKLVQELVAVSS
ncbi:MAG: cyanophycin synthetase, partial [Pseudomonadota bacterium]